MTPCATVLPDYYFLIHCNSQTSYTSYRADCREGHGVIIGNIQSVSIPFLFLFFFH